jgi:hypothetical protein
MALPPICSFWHGPLSFLERVCIASFLDKGHQFTLYVYEDVGDVPHGCMLANAADVVPREQMFFYKGSRTPAVFADLFRLRLMQRKAGVWSDCDVYCVRPLENPSAYVFGIENDPGWRNFWQAEINNAVFLCPPQSALLDSLLSVFTSGAIPPGLPIWRAAEVRLRRMAGDPLPVHHMQFGATGPAPLNHYVRQLGLMHHVSRREVFYPMAYGAAKELLEPGSQIEPHITHQTLGVHMWHSALTGRRSGQMLMPKPDSFFAREMSRLSL